MTPEEILRSLRDGERFLLTSHTNPDGDAIGSELALQRILRQAGKEAVVWNLHPSPGVYQPLPGASEIHVGTSPPAGFPAAFDAVVVLECPTLDRTGLEEELLGRTLLNIDHHLGNARYGIANWVDSEAPAVAEMVAEVARDLDLTLDSTTADCLLLALVTDTGGFRFANATPRAFEAAAALVRAGARPDRVSHWIYESQPERAVRLLGEMLATLELHAGGRVASALLTREAFARAGALPGDSEGLIDTPRSIAGVEAVALLRELEEGAWKISLRSRGPVDVERVARAMGGGGHKNAAGCKGDGDVASLRSRIVEALAASVEAAHGA